MGEESERSYRGGRRMASESSKVISEKRTSRQKGVRSGKIIQCRTTQVKIKKKSRREKERQEKV